MLCSPQGRRVELPVTTPHAPRKVTVAMGKDDISGWKDSGTRDGGEAQDGWNTQ
jgi:hypothetical protein